MTSTVVIILALVLAGLALLLMEILTPTFGVLAAGAIGAEGAAVYLAFTVSGIFGTLLLIAVLIAIPTYLVALVKFLPDSRLGRHLFLRKLVVEPGEGTPDAGELKRFVGRTGTAETQLRPSGTVRVDGRRIDAVAEHGMLERGATVTILRSRGTDVVVRRADVPEPSE